MKHGVLIDIDAIKTIKQWVSFVGVTYPALIDSAKAIRDMIEREINIAPDAVIPVLNSNVWENCPLALKVYGDEKICYKTGTSCRALCFSGRCPQITKG